MNLQIMNTLRSFAFLCIIIALIIWGHPGSFIFLFAVVIVSLTTFLLNKRNHPYGLLEKFGIDYEMTIISAHREPDVFFEYAKTAESKGFKVIIAGAGMAAHLPGMCAAIFPMPVIGIPMHTTSLGGRDSLYSIVQMPTGIPVATVAINGGANAGILAAKILATSDEELLSRLKAYSEEMKEQVVEKDAKLQKVGYKNYAK